MLVDVSLYGLRAAIDFYNKFPCRYRALFVDLNDLDDGLFPSVVFSKGSVPDGCVFIDCVGCLECLKCAPGAKACDRCVVSLDDAMLALYAALLERGYEMRIV